MWWAGEFGGSVTGAPTRQGTVRGRGIGFPLGTGVTDLLLNKTYVAPEMCTPDPLGNSGGAMVHGFLDDCIVIGRRIHAELG